MASKGYDSDRDVDSDENSKANNAAQFPIGIVKRFAQRYEATEQDEAGHSKLITPSLQDKYLEKYNQPRHNAQKQPDTPGPRRVHMRQSPNQSQNITNQDTNEQRGNYGRQHQRQSQNFRQQSPPPIMEHMSSTYKVSSQQDAPDTRDNNWRQNQRHTHDYTHQAPPPITEHMSSTYKVSSQQDAPDPRDNNWRQNQRHTHDYTHQDAPDPRDNNWRQHQRHTHDYSHQDTSRHSGNHWPQNLQPRNFTHHDTSEHMGNHCQQSQRQSQNLTHQDTPERGGNHWQQTPRESQNLTHQATPERRGNHWQQNPRESQNLTHQDTSEQGGNHWQHSLRQSQNLTQHASPFKGWAKPMLWIQPQMDSKYTVVKETDTELRKIKEDMVIVAIVGPYRTGKSHLMNLIAGRKAEKWNCNGFEVGNTVQAKTKGIWILCLPHPEKENTVLALLDSEGFGDVMKVTGEHETNILLLNILLSSTLLYNSIGVLDAKGVQQLQYVANMAAKVTVDDGSLKEIYESDNALAMVFPSFIWVLRDFKLDLKGRTPNKYLEEALFAQAGSSTHIALSNAARDCISRYFPSRQCMCVPPLEFPHANEKLRELAAYIKGNADIKRIEALPVNGKALAELALCYTYAISTKTTICVLNVWGNVLCEHFNDVYKQAINIFEKGFTSAGSYQEARLAACNHLIEHKCYDFRFLNQLMMYMKERKSGKTRINAQTHATVNIKSGGEDGKMHLKEFLELNKDDTVPRSVMESIINNFEERLDKSQKMFTDLIDHFKRELQIAKNDPREYREQHLQTFNRNYQKITNDRLNLLQAHLAELLEEKK